MKSMRGMNITSLLVRATALAVRTAAVIRPSSPITCASCRESSSTSRFPDRSRDRVARRDHISAGAGVALLEQLAPPRSNSRSVPKASNRSCSGGNPSNSATRDSRCKSFSSDMINLSPPLAFVNCRWEFVFRTLEAAPWSGFLQVPAFLARAGSPDDCKCGGRRARFPGRNLGAPDEIHPRCFRIAGHCNICKWGRAVMLANLKPGGGPVLLCPKATCPAVPQPQSGKMIAVLEITGGFARLSPYMTRADAASRLSRHRNVRLPERLALWGGPPHLVTGDAAADEAAELAALEAERPKPVAKQAIPARPPVPQRAPRTASADAAQGSTVSAPAKSQAPENPTGLPPLPEAAASIAASPPH